MTTHTYTAGTRDCPPRLARIVCTSCADAYATGHFFNETHAWLFCHATHTN